MPSPLSFSPTLTAAPIRNRVPALDVLRGLTVAAMILVTNPGTYAARYAPLAHADWEGATPTDLIFPTFLLLVGVAIPFAYAAQRARGARRASIAWRALRRCLALIGLGLVLNGLPDYHWATMRLPGILQRIGVCYLGGALLYAALSPADSDKDPTAPRQRAYWLVGVSGLLLAGYWAALRLVPIPGIGAGHLDPYGNLPAYLDRLAFGIPHLWAYGLAPGRGVVYDPEGLLATLPALVNVLVGIGAGDWLRRVPAGRRQVLGLAVGGLALAGLSLALSPWLPINKRIWTSSFALLSSGGSLLLLAGSCALVVRWPSRNWTMPARVFGSNALLGFALSQVLLVLFDRVHLGGLTVHEWGYAQLLATGLLPINASLAYALLMVALNWLLLWPLFRREVLVRL